MNWPYVNENAISEFEPSGGIFAKSFPWLFPGGTGDITLYHSENIDIVDWMKRMIRYKDGRFSRDKMFAFYVLDYVNRHQNSSQGSFFVNGWCQNEALSLNKIKTLLKAGKTSILDKISYYAARVKGSSSYWRNKKFEVKSWMNHHVAEKNGAPTFFITLSCAEYHWKDIERLINERYRLAGQELPDFRKNRVQVINENTLVVQEYFQARTMDWLTTIGKQIFRIKHYWVRYEFAPSRGQIHAHLFAISDYMDIFQMAFKLRDDDEACAKFLAKWASEQFGLSCDVSDSNVNESDIHPASMIFSEIDDYDVDINRCKQFLQMHKCSGYCMRKRKYT